jgi:HSP20 family molecular chaperone IbpA
MKKIDRKDLITLGINNALNGGSSPFQFVTKRVEDGHLLILHQAGVDPRNMDLKFKEDALLIHHRFGEKSDMMVTSSELEDKVLRFFPEMVHKLKLPKNVNPEAISAKAMGNRLEVHLPTYFEGGIYLDRNIPIE